MTKKVFEFHTHKCSKFVKGLIKCAKMKLRVHRQLQLVSERNGGKPDL